MFIRYIYQNCNHLISLYVYYYKFFLFFSKELFPERNLCYNNLRLKIAFIDFDRISCGGSAARRSENILSLNPFACRQMTALPYRLAAI